MKNPDWLEKTKQLRSAGSFQQTLAHLAEVLLERPPYWPQVLIYSAARKEIRRWPMEVKKDFWAIMTKIQKGERVGFPDTAGMNTVAPGCFEARIQGGDGIYRAFYVFKSEFGILVFHGFKRRLNRLLIRKSGRGPAG